MLILGKVDESNLKLVKNYFTDITSYVLEIVGLPINSINKAVNQKKVVYDGSSNSERRYINVKDAAKITAQIMQKKYEKYSKCQKWPELLQHVQDRPKCCNTPKIAKKCSNIPYIAKMPYNTENYLKCSKIPKVS